MDQFFGDPACWQLGAAGIRLRSGETHVSPVSQSIVTTSKWEVVNTVLELKAVFTIESFLLWIICIRGEWNKLNSFARKISDVVSHRNFQQRLMHYENSSVGAVFPVFLSHIFQMSLFSDSFTALTAHNCRSRWRKNPNCHRNSGLGCESSFNRPSDCLLQHSSPLYF